MKEITVQELAEMLKNNPSFTLLDVREDYEYELGHIDCDCKHIPMGQLAERIDELDKDKTVYVICKSGNRASAVANFIKINFGLENIGVVLGGVEAYANEIDESIQL